MKDGKDGTHLPSTNTCVRMVAYGFRVLGIGLVLAPLVVLALNPGIMAKTYEETCVEKVAEHGWSPALARCSLGHEYARVALYGGSARPSAKEEAARRRLAARSVELLKSCSAM